MCASRTPRGTGRSARSRMLTRQRGGVWSLAFNPANPERLYLGLSADE